MRLSQLYCNDERFKNIRFNLNGENIIYADVKTTVSDTKNAHNVGKSTLIKLLDFLMCGKIRVKSKHFFYKTDPTLFANHIFYLEILLDQGIYLTIKRTVKNSSKISFSTSSNRAIKFSPPESWEYENMGFEKAKETFKNYISFPFFLKKEYDYRKSISYTMRNQKDYVDIYKLDKFTGGKHIDWKPFMFDLLGFSGKLLRLKYEYHEEIEQIDKQIETLEKEFRVGIDDRDELIAAIDIKRDEIESLSSKIDKFDFSKKDKQVIEYTVDEVESEISQKNAMSYTLKYEVSQIQKSVTTKIHFDVEKTQELFSEANILFPNQLKKSFVELMEFNKKMTKERIKLLKKTLLLKEEQISVLDDELEQLNAKKAKAIQYLQETSAFKKFKEYQKQQINVEAELSVMESKIKVIDKIIKLNERIEAIEKKIAKVVEKIKLELQKTENNPIYSTIRKHFTSYFKLIFDSNAILTLKLNTNNNVEFVNPIIKNDLKKATSEGDGYTYNKLLCVCFDLAILATYSTQPFFHYVYHDDVLGSEDNGVKTRLLQLIDNVITKYNIQYVYSVIKGDMPLDAVSGKRIIPHEDKIVLRLNDEDETGTIFGFKY